MTKEELLAEKLEVDENIQRIREVISAMIGAEKATGRRVHDHKFAKLQDDLRILRRRSQEIQNLLSAMRRKPGTLPQTFMRVALRSLPSKTYEIILEQAKLELDQILDTRRD